MSLASIAESLRNALSLSRQSAAEIKSKLAELKAERKRISEALLCRADLEALVLASLERQKQRALADTDLINGLQYGHMLAGAWANGDDLATLTDMTPVTNRFDSLCTLSEMDKLAALLSEPRDILARLKPIFDGMDFSNAGRPMQSRRAKVTQLDSEIAKLEAELAGIESAIQQTTDVAPVQSAELPYGTRRELEPGVWATWGATSVGARPGWIHDSR